MRGDLDATALPSQDPVTTGADDSLSSDDDLAVPEKREVSSASSDQAPTGSLTPAGGSPEPPSHTSEEDLPLPVPTDGAVLPAWLRRPSRWRQISQASAEPRISRGNSGSSGPTERDLRPDGEVASRLASPRHVPSMRNIRALDAGEHQDWQTAHWWREHSSEPILNREHTTSLARRSNVEGADGSRLPITHGRNSPRGLARGVERAYSVLDESSPVRRLRAQTPTDQDAVATAPSRRPVGDRQPPRARTATQSAIARLTARLTQAIDAGGSATPAAAEIGPLLEPVETLPGRSFGSPRRDSLSGAETPAGGSTSATPARATGLPQAPRTPASGLFRVYDDARPAVSQPQTPLNLPEARHQSRLLSGSWRGHAYTVPAGRRAADAGEQGVSIVGQGRNASGRFGAATTGQSETPTTSTRAAAAAGEATEARRRGRGLLYGMRRRSGAGVGSADPDRERTIAQATAVTPSLAGRLGMRMRGSRREPPSPPGLQTPGFEGLYGGIENSDDSALYELAARERDQDGES